MELFQGQDQGLCQTLIPCLWLPGVDLRASSFGYTDQLVSPCGHSSHFKGSMVICWVHFHSALMISWSWPHLSWWPPLMLFICASVQSMPLLDLQDVLTLFLYFLWAILTDISLVSQAGEAIPRSSVQVGVWLSFLWTNWSLRTLGPQCSWGCLPLHHHQGLAGPPVGLEEGLGDSHHGSHGVSLSLWCWVRHMVIAPCESYVHSWPQHLER